MALADDAGDEVTTTGAKKPPAIWMFIALDCTSFGLFFFVFMSERIGQAAAFDQSSRLLDPRLGLLNTCILITASLLVATANHAGRNGRFGHARSLLVGALAVAACFGLVKTAEYVDKLRAGITVVTDEFFTFYFALTGLHFLHYLIGLGVLAKLAHGAGRAHATPDARAGYLAWLDGGALYWHMVDLLWVFLFCMLYLLGVK